MSLSIGKEPDPIVHPSQKRDGWYFYPHRINQYKNNHDPLICWLLRSTSVTSCWHRGRETAVQRSPSNVDRVPGHRRRPPATRRLKLRAARLRGAGGAVVSDEAVRLPPAGQQRPVDRGVEAVVGRLPSKQHLQGLQGPTGRDPHKEV